MFAPFLALLRDGGVPVSLREYLTFLGGLQAGLSFADAEEFYFLARTTLVKDERHIDRFDRAFATAFGGLTEVTPEVLLTALNLPPEWLARLTERHLTDAEKAAIAALGGLEKLLDTLRQRLAEQQGRHQGGSKWVGTAGTSPFGAWGYNPEGIRIGQTESRQRRAVKVWDQRAFADYDDSAALGTRTMQVALRRLRRFARQGAAEELDLPGTIQATARQGYVDVHMRPERRNAVKVLLFLDVGGSMDDHVEGVQNLFAAARSAFRHLEQVYFHNCLYEQVWRQNRRRWEDRMDTADLLRRFGPDWRVVFVGDAAMSPYEITHPGGANEHWNSESGATWLTRACAAWPRHLWINPVPEALWGGTRSTGLIQGLLAPGAMVPLTLDGLTRGMASLAR